jgi:hypothetical protein
MAREVVEVFWTSGLKSAAIPARKDFTVTEMIIPGPAGEKIRIVSCGPEAAESVVHAISSMISTIRPAETSTTAVEDLQGVVEVSVRELCGLLDGHDPFDVMAFVRQYLAPPDLSMWSESDSTVEASWACAEVIALALLGTGLPKRPATTTASTASIVPEAVRRAAHIVQLSQIEALNAMGARRDDEIGQLAAQFCSHETSVRGRQYDTIARLINTAVLEGEQSVKIWRETLAYAYADVLDVRKAISDICVETTDAHCSQIRAASQAGAAEPDGATKDAMGALFVTPSILSVVTAELVVKRVSVDVDIIRAILDRFAIVSDNRDSQKLVGEFVHGRNPMAGKGIIHDGAGRYLVLPGAIALDEIRRTCEPAIKGTGAWSSYNRQRAKAAEKLTADTIRRLADRLGDLREGVMYRAITRSQASVDLSATSTTADLADLAEADVLLVLDGVALCVEVKAGEIRLRSRQGGSEQLRSDLKKTVKAAASQTDRLRDLITTHGGLWLQDGNWLDLASIEEVYSVVVCLDDLGPLASTTAQLVRGGVLAQTNLPWVISLHDLLVCAEILTEPAQFLTYLRRRTNRDAAIWVTAADELDVLMWFVTGGFFFEPDPERIHARHPETRPPTGKDKKSYAEQGRTIVGTFTDDLDAWYYWREGSSSRSADPPRRDMAPDLRQLTQRLREGQEPGWLRMSADLDGLSSKAQEDLADTISTIRRRTARDGGFHTCGLEGADDSGRWLLVAATGPDTPRTREHLHAYLTAKKHHDRADRAMAILLDADGDPRMTFWLSHPLRPDPELDHLARAMGLPPADRAPRVLPPKAKRPQKRRPTKKRRPRR